nr:putative ribonuclease H-like domain-containing protein [Tanacetum cinerariifolium]
GNPQHTLKDKGVIDSGWSRHMTWNMSYLFDFEELNSGYVVFGGNLKGDTFQLPDDPNVPELEDITYSDDEDDVGAEADFNNLETTITEEGINYKEVFTPAARIEAIRLFLSYSSFMGFMVYQMDVKSAFLYGTIEEEVYVCQPPGFKDPDYPDKVYKVVKALYGLHQALRAWYETLANYLLEMVFKKARYVVPKSWIYYLE